MLKNIDNIGVLKLGDNVNTDLIHPAEYFSLDDTIITEGLFKGLDEEISLEDLKNKIIVAGKNLGCGSSREVYAKALKLIGVKVIIAESFARIFYRNLVNNTIIPIQILSTKSFNPGDKINISLSENKIYNNRTRSEYDFNIDPFIIQIVENGGLIKKLKDD